MQAPPQVDAKSPSDYLAVITRAVFQSGMSWDVVRAKWDGIQSAFHDFDAERVAELNELEIDEIASNPAVIRNRRKIEATVANAGQLLEIEDEYGDIESFLEGLPDFEAKVKALRKRFKYLGETGCYYFLYVVGQEVPPYDAWRASRDK